MNLQKADKRTLFIGPSLDKGPLPALFYFALSAEDSLQRDPYNQPVQFLQGLPLRIFSITLPAHENNFPPEKAMNVWAERIQNGERLIPTFIEKVRESIETLSPHFTSCAVSGLSRGAFIACHVAALCPQITHILGYAPLTRLSYAPELNLETLVSKLVNRNLRFYIGNNDIRVGTENVFSFIHTLAKEATVRRIRNAPIEMIIGPSKGYQGHGTSPDVFQSGVDYLKKELSL
jgi:esterase FrsA